MRLADVDLAAVSGDSVLHRASPQAKLIAAACLLAAVVVSTNVLVVAALGLALVATAAFLGLELRPLLLAAAYPTFFALVFALAAAGDVLFGALIVSKAVAAALLVVLLAWTTPYPRLLAPVQRLLPSVLADALLFTYRSFFLLAEKVTRLLRAVRLRSGLHVRQSGASVRAGGRALGGLLLFGMDLAQRDADVLRLRGYENRLLVTRERSTSMPRDAMVVAAASAGLALALAWRLAYAALNPYSWLPVLLSAAALALAAVVRLVTRSPEAS